MQTTRESPFRRLLSKIVSSSSRRKAIDNVRMNAKTSAVGSLTPYEAWEIVSSLTKPGSEFQQEVKSREGSQTPISLVFDGSWTIVSWAATHTWKGQQTLEGFTRPEWRNRGVMRVAAAMLVASGKVNPLLPVAVFSPACISIATSVGCRRVRLYELRDGLWVENS